MSKATSPSQKICLIDLTQETEDPEDDLIPMRKRPETGPNPERKKLRTYLATETESPETGLLPETK
jgi:hypothetical protein